MQLLWQQFRILLWKCFLVRKRSKVVLGFEILLPLVTSGIIAGIIAYVGSLAKNYDPNAGKDVQANVWNPPTYFDKATFQGFDISAMSGYLLYTPDNDATRQIMTEAYEIYNATNNFNLLKLIALENEADVVSKFEQLSSNYSVLEHACSGIVFEGITKTTSIKDVQTLRYKLRVAPFINLPSTTQVYSIKTRNGPRNPFNDFFDDDYVNTDFPKLQFIVNEAFLNLKAKALEKVRVPTGNFEAYRYPYPGFWTRGAQLGVSAVIPYVIIFGFIITSPIIIRRIIEEKINRSREMFRMMGLSDWIYWTTTFLSYMIVYTLQAGILVMLLCVKFTGVFAVLQSVNWLLLFVILFMYGVHFILFSMLISIPMSRPVVGVVLSILIWAVTFVLPYFTLNPIANTAVNLEATTGWRIAVTFVPNFNLAMIMQLIQQRELYSSVATFSNLFEHVSIFGSYTIGFILCIQLASCALICLLIWYLDAVWPWQDGVPKPFYFPFTRVYWLGHSGGDPLTVKYDLGHDGKFFERQVSSAETAISIRHLRKEFGKKVAVDDISMDVNHGQITCLLGHNGAGKTTTMNMITGIFPATSGTISVNGFDVALETRQARLSMSLCPQHNVLYDELTVLQHLQLYAAIKGVRWEEIGSEADIAAQKAQLEDAKFKFPSQLSGGMKRKLCLGIALVGGTKVVILDEPTSGMDPEARRGIWDLLRSVRRECTILLTTHYMEEADALGDSIAIMTAGKISCFGTPMFLKKAFSAGYQLRIAKAPNFDHNAVESLITHFFPNGQLKSEIDTEIIYTLESANNKTDTSVLPKFFKDIKKKKLELGIATCGLSLTTMEDVFLKVGELAADDDVATNGNGKIESSHPSTTVGRYDQPIRVSGLKLNMMRLKGLFLKRFHYGKRYWPMLIFQILIPALLFVVILLLNNKYLSPTTYPPLELNLEVMYGKTEGWFIARDDQAASFFDPYADTLTQLEGAHVQNIADTDDPNEYLMGIANTSSLDDYIKKNLIGALVDKAPYQPSYSRAYQVWYNDEVLHSMPSSMNALYEALFREVSGSSKSSIEVVNHPFPQSMGDFGQLPDPAGLMFLWLFLVPLSIPFLTASYVMFPIHERVSKAKLLQLMTGLHPALFWISSFLFDFIAHILATVLILVIFAIFDTHGIFIGTPTIAGALFMIVFMCGLSAIPFAYVWSAGPKRPAAGFAGLVIAYIISTIIFTVAASINPSFNGQSALSEQFHAFLIWVFRASPVFSLTWGFGKLFETGVMPAYCRAVPQSTLDLRCTPTVIPVRFSIYVCCPKNICHDDCASNANPWEWGDKGISQELFMMAVMFFVNLLILTLIEIGWKRTFAPLFSRCRQSFRSEDRTLLINETPAVIYGLDTSAQAARSGDGDVVAEQFRVDRLVETDSVNQEALVVQNLKRNFSKFTAVNELSFGVHKRECFGLLGVNGAGKTTTFRMLTGDLEPTSGNAQANDFDILKSLGDFQQQLGYCPQFDALLDKMTGREMLFLFGRLRGISESDLQRCSDELIEMADLHKHADKPTETYSGGNKRKLSLALALIGSPSLLLLDEPTSGVDPGARRKIWTTLANVRRELGCSIILTSHSMEECEALCSRVAIMVNGQFKCLGPIQHLRDKYGEGYTVIIKLKRHMIGEGRHSLDVQEHVKATIRGAVLRDAHETVINYHITDTSLSWADLFEHMEDIKAHFNLEDYSVSDTTLEQIFIAFARHQAAENNS